ncbi:EpsG family protein [Hoylesella saccharolytica]|uniref:EpsG family protein n=1 Tax=Hoylesella saccharolytica TaxID=633701 RepID=UPI00046FAD5F|nr:EpsG family protein [Hoylesella saccharolytica]
MLLYILIFGSTLFWFFVSKKKSEKNIRGLFIFFSFLALFVGLSDMLGGYDRYIYGEVFDILSDDIEKGFSYKKSPIMGYEKEFGYVFLNVILSHITSNRYIFILLVTIIIYILFFFSIKEYTENYPFACILFLALMFFFTFTYLREVIGVGVSWFSLKYIYQRNLKMFLFIMFIAFSFHNSAIIFLPMYFIPIRKYNISAVIFVMVVAFIIGLSPFPGALFSRFGELSGSEERVMQYAQDYEEAGFRIEYLLEVAVFLFIIFPQYKEISNSRRSLVLLNCALMFCIILLFFIRSSSGGRLGWYYMIGIIALFTELAVKENQQNQVSIILIILSCLLYGRILIGWNIRAYPYKTFLTNGHRKGDPIYEQYEYDKQYDQDKFYRPAFKLK